jgi:hypothetical protein
MPDIYRARALLLGKSIAHLGHRDHGGNCTLCGYTLADVGDEGCTLRGPWYEIVAAFPKAYPGEISCKDLACVAEEQISGTMPPEADDDKSSAGGAA